MNYRSASAVRRIATLLLFFIVFVRANRDSDISFNATLVNTKNNDTIALSDTVINIFRVRILSATTLLIVRERHG
ncbi:MAG: hypothetical protein P4M11_12050 [Candidatus Pacebacteria bacterium]|nr:hypothetical protein [Candidatus Paceibacterota bacterium]